MELVALPGCGQWCRQHTWELEANPPVSPARPKGWPLLTFDIPPIADTQLRMAGEVQEWSRASTRLLWLTDWPAFNDNQVELFNVVSGRAAKLLIDWPGLLISADDSTLLTHTLFTVFAFNWQGYLLDEQHHLFIWLADEVLEVGSPSRSKLGELEARLGKLGVATFG